MLKSLKPMRRWAGAAVCMVVFLTVPARSQTQTTEGSLLQALEAEVRGLVSAVSPSIVTVRCWPREARGSGESMSRLPGPMSIGSGIILDSLGHILTTARVVEGCDDFWVDLPDGRFFRAVMVGANEDVAVLSAEFGGIVPPEFGDVADLGVGSFVAVVGNSYGFAPGFTRGEVNGFRPDGTIQLSLSVSAGSSGGALVDARGRVVGLMRAKISEPFYIDPLHLPATDKQPAIDIPGRRLELPTSAVSLAIPIGTALRAAARLMESGDASPAYVGVYVEDLTRWQQAHFKTRTGVLVTGVVPQTPAHHYGLQRGDVLTRIDREEVSTVRRFRQIVSYAKPGQRLLFDIIRGGKPLKLVVEVGRAGIPHLTTAAAEEADPQERTPARSPARPESGAMGAMRLDGSAVGDTVSGGGDSTTTPLSPDQPPSAP